MKKMFEDRSRESSGMIRSGNRKYMKRGASPDGSTNVSSGQKSNQELMSQVVPHLIYPSYSNQRYRDKNTKMSSSKLASREESLINYELLGLSHSKNFMGDRRKKGRSSFYKKVSDAPMNS